MSTRYSGNPNNVSNSLTRTITGAANNGSGAIRITTSVAHLFSTNDAVIITAVGGTIEANGTWSITAIDSTRFDLQASTFTNAYTSGGSVTDRSLTPAATLPSDGEQATVGTVLAAVQLLLDRTQFLATRPVVQTTIIIPPIAFNVSTSRDWIIGDASTGARVVKAVANDNALVVDVTPYLVGQAGRSLAQITTYLAVGQSHASVPATLPTMRLYRTMNLATSVGGAPSADQSLLAATDAAFPTPGSAAAWYASGHVQKWSLTTNQNAVIDASRRYYLILFDETGSGALPLNIYYGMQLIIN